MKPSVQWSRFTISVPPSYRTTAPLTIWPLRLNELAEDAVALVGPDFLDHDLLGRLGGDSPESLDIDGLAVLEGA